VVLMAKCRSCGAQIEWATTAAGKAIPLNPYPVNGGNLEFRGRMVHYVQPNQTPRFTSHFSDCPNASNHRKERRR
jgi:hypothetical protein